jgi:cytochrome b6-f complex iron-sulfur subunit
MRPGRGTTIAKGSGTFDKERLVTTRRLFTVVEVSSQPVLEPSRRQFCAHACQAASLVAFGTLLPACGGGDDDGNPTSPSGPATNQALPIVNGSVTGRTVSVPVSGALASPNSVALVTASLGSFLVFRNSLTSFTVLTAVCTHEGCTVDQFNGQLYVCPCHNSKYTTSGQVANGPANRALTTFPSTLSGDTLTFTA